ncbi:MAG: hypothetical protein K0S33_2998 [Bacteroidetes bacterium]|nr:hypothetical protein [Bacteroidota bacterium]
MLILDRTKKIIIFAARYNDERFLSDGVTGNTLDFDSRKSRFEPWSDNRKENP